MIMKHTKLYSILLYSLLYNVAGAQPLGKETTAIINQTVRVFDDTENGHHVRKFFENQKTAAKYLTLPADIETSMKTLCASMHSVHFQSVPDLVAAYLSNTGQMSKETFMDTVKAINAELTWLHIGREYVRQIFGTDSTALVNEFIKQVEMFDVSGNALTTMTRILRELDGLHDDVKAKLNVYIDSKDIDSKLGKVIKSLDEKDMEEVLLALHNGRDNLDKARAIALIELYLDHKHRKVETSNTVTSYLKQFCLNGFMGALWTIGAGSAILKITMDYNSRFNFYRDVLPACGTNICPGAFAPAPTPAP